MELQFWGVRGSIPTPGPYTVEVGGNTICVSLHLNTESTRGKVFHRVDLGWKSIVIYI